MKIDPARMTKAQARGTYNVLVAEIRAVRNSTALLMWHKMNWHRVDAMPVSWHGCMDEEFDISLKALLESETGAHVEVNAQHFTEKESDMTSVYDETGSPSNALKVKDLAGSDVVLTIKGTDIAEFDETSKAGEAYKKKRVVLQFNETEKTMVLNVTNLNMVVSHYSDERDGWPGKKITLYPTTTPYNNETVDCMRIRPPATGKTVSQGLPGGDASVGHANQDIPQF